MEAYYEQNSINFWIYTICLLIILSVTITIYIKIKSIYPVVVKQSFLHLILLGILPTTMIAWIGMLFDVCAKMLAVVTLYLMGVSIILLRRYALIFLREMPKIHDCPHLKYQLQLMQEIKDHSVIYYIGVIYFFLMGTVFFLDFF